MKLHTFCKTTYFLPAISKQLLSRTNWKILHLTNFFYTTSGCDGCDNYQVWLRVCLCSTQDLLIIFFLYLAFNLHCFLFVFLLEIVFVYTSALVNEEEAVLVACMSVLYSRLADCPSQTCLTQVWLAGKACKETLDNTITSNYFFSQLFMNIWKACKET